MQKSLRNINKQFAYKALPINWPWAVALGSATTRGAAGAVSTTTRRSPSPHADSWSPSGVRFPLRLTLVWRALAWRLFACRLPGGYAPSDPNGRVELKPPTPASVTIRALRRHLLARRFAVPKLQRNFVWDAGRAAKLLDRIYREMPIYGYSDCHMSSNYG